MGGGRAGNLAEGNGDPCKDKRRVKSEIYEGLRGQLPGEMNPGPKNYEGAKGGGGKKIYGRAISASGKALPISSKCLGGVGEGCLERVV